MSWIPPTSNTSAYSEYEVRGGEDYEYLGTTDDGAPVLYDQSEGTVHRGEVDGSDTMLIPDTEPSWDIQPQETVGEFLERVGESVGWDSLSQFAREHLDRGQR